LGIDRCGQDTDKSDDNVTVVGFAGASTTGSGAGGAGTTGGGGATGSFAVTTGAFDTNNDSGIGCKIGCGFTKVTFLGSGFAGSGGGSTFLGGLIKLTNKVPAS
jgi:hypothetical protein